MKKLVPVRRVVECNVGHVIPHAPVRQWVLIWVMRQPIPLRLLLAAQPKLVTPVLQDAALHKINNRMMKMRTRREGLVEEQGST